MRKFVFTAISISVAGMLALASPVVAQTTVTVFAPSTNTDLGVWFENDVRTGGTASIADLSGDVTNLGASQPLPIGAAKLTTDFTNPAKAEVGVLNDYGIPDDIFDTISLMYDFHKATNGAQNLAAAPSIKPTFFNGVCDDTTVDDCFGTLVYEPYLQGSGNPPLDTWQSEIIDENTGVFWSTGGFNFVNTGGGPPYKTLAEWLAQSSPDFADATLFRISIGVGSSNQGQVGYFDDVVIAGTNADDSYDFDPAQVFETLGECVSTLIADECSDLNGRERATCNHIQQMACFDIFEVP